MIQVNSIREKLNVSVIFALVFYIVAGVLVVMWLLPIREQEQYLQASLEQLRREEENLSRIVAERPGLEARLRETEENLRALETDFPTQYDLRQVQDVLSMLSVYHGLDMLSTDHIPLRAESGDLFGIIPMTMRLKGDERLLSYITHIQTSLPTLDVYEVQLAYDGARQFDMTLRMNLHVLVVAQANLSTWEFPALTELSQVSLPTPAFGVSFDTVEKFLEQRVQVLGVVEAGLQSRALLRKDGRQSWYRLGERLDEAVISSISESGVWLDVDGVQLK